MIFAALLAVCFLLILEKNNYGYVNGTLTLLVVVFSCVNVDIIRARVRRGPILTYLFAVGTIGAVFNLEREAGSFQNAMLCCLIQWSPVVAYNIFFLCRIGLHFKFQWIIRNPLISPRLLLFAILALFDGALLSAPASWFPVADTIALRQLQVVNRIFSGSLPAIPAIYAFSYTPSYRRISKILKLSPPSLYFLLSSFSIFVLGLVYSILWSFIVKDAVSWSLFGSASILGCAFSFFSSRIRFIDTGLRNRCTERILIVVLPSLLIAELFLVYARGGSFCVTILQACSFGLVGCVIGEFKD
jgi:hypothetical protein